MEKERLKKRVFSVLIYSTVANRDETAPAIMTLLSIRAVLNLKITAEVNKQ